MNLDMENVSAVIFTAEQEMGSSRNVFASSGHSSAF